MPQDNTGGILHIGLSGYRSKEEMGEVKKRKSSKDERRSRLGRQMRGNNIALMKPEKDGTNHLK